MRKLICLILMTVLALCCAIALAETETGEIGGGTWTLDDNGVLTFSGPADVSSWRSNGTKYQNLLTKVVYGSEVTNIQNDMYSYCYNLTAFEVDPDNRDFCSVDGVVYTKDMTQLIEAPTAKSGKLTIPEGVKTIRRSAFIGSYLEEVILPESLTTIEDQAFWNARFKRLHLSAGVVNIDASALNLNQIEEFIVAEENPQYCAKDGVLFNKDQTTLIHYTSGGTTEEYTIPAGVKTIGSYSFAFAKSLRTLTISEGVTTIDRSAFQFFYPLKEIFLPASLQKINSDAFQNMRDLQTISYAGTQEEWALVTIASGNKELLQNEIQCSNGVVKGQEEEAEEPFVSETHSGTLGDLEWNLSLEEWGGYLSVTGSGAMPDLDVENNEAWLAYRDSITYVYISDGITSIGANAFDSCNAISDLSLYGTLETIGEAAFRNCSGLYRIILPATLTGIGDNCFSGCTGLEDVCYNGTKAKWGQITISETGNDPLINMPIQCYDGIIGLPSEGICGDNLTWTLDNKGTLTISGNGGMYDYKHYGPWHLSNKEIHKVILEDGVTSIGAHAFGGNGCEMTEISIPGSVTQIGTYAFHGCFRLAGITIPEGVTSIAPHTFIYCASLTEIHIPSTVKSIGSGAFEECYGLSKVTIAEGVESLEGPVFMQCYGLKSLSIPRSIKRISGNTVRYCDKLKDIYYNGTQADWNRIIFENADGDGSLKKKNIHFATFTASGTCGEELNWTLDSKGVLTVYGTGAMEDYNEDPAPWDGYRKKIKSVVIENGVTVIGSCAFSGYATLTSVKLPESLLTIGSEAFASCKLSGITMPFGIETTRKDFFYPGSDQMGHLYHIDLPAGVTEVGFAAFYGNPFPSDDPDFILPSDLITVEAEAFAGIDARFVWIPDRVTSIGAGAFANCPNLEYIYIPYGCAIGEDALPEDTVILGISGSPVETTYGNRFIELEDPYGGNG